MSLIISLVATGLLSLSAIAVLKNFQKLSSPLFLLTAPVAFSTGCQWYDVYVTHEGMMIGLVFIFYSYLCLIMASVMQLRKVE